MAEKQEFKVLFRRRWPQYIGAISGSLSIFVNLISSSSLFSFDENLFRSVSVSIVIYQGREKKKKNLGDISLTIPSNSGGEFQFWNAKIANSPINLLRRIFRGIFFLFFFFYHQRSIVKTFASSPNLSLTCTHNV